MFKDNKINTPEQSVTVNNKDTRTMSGTSIVNLFAFYSTFNVAEFEQINAMPVGP